MFLAILPLSCPKRNPSKRSTWFRPSPRKPSEMIPTGYGVTNTLEKSHVHHLHRPCNYSQTDLKKTVLTLDVREPLLCPDLGFNRTHRYSGNILIGQYGTANGIRTLNGFAIRLAVSEFCIVNILSVVSW